MKTYKITFEFSTESDRHPLAWLPSVMDSVLESDETFENYTSEEMTENQQQDESK